MEIYRTEEEQVAALRQWWRRHGKAVLLGVVIGLGWVFGWQGWKNYQFKQSVVASSEFQKLLVALRDVDAPAGEIAEQIQRVQEYRSTTYSDFATLIMAQQAVAAGDLSVAAEQLEAFVARQSQPQLQQIALLRLGRIYLAAGEIDKAQRSAGRVDGEPFAGSRQELLGDILLQKGDVAGARRAYEQALQEADGDDALIRIKLEDMGHKLQ